MVEVETKLKNESQLTLIRHLVKLLREHRKELEAHCSELEKDVDRLADADGQQDGKAGLFRYLENLEDSVKQCLTEFDRLKITGLKSLASVPHALPRPGTMAAHEMQEMSMVGPGALLKAIETQTQNLLRLPPEPPDLMNPTHRNALLMKSKHTEAMIRKRQALSDKPTGSMGASNVKLMLEDNAIPEQFFMAETHRIKVEEENAAREAKRLEDERRYAEFKRKSRAPGQQHDDDELEAIEDEDERPPQHEPLRLAASSNNNPQALMDFGNQPPQLDPPSAIEGPSNEMPSITDQGTGDVGNETRGTDA
jgi:hypothetical protein